jgi:hypothetical protein
VPAVLCQTPLSCLPRFPLLRQWPRKLFSLDCSLTEQVPNRGLALCKGTLDVLVCGHAKVHAREHKPNDLCCATVLEAE